MTIRIATRTETFKLLDISKMIEPKSDQQNFDDYLAGDRIVTISEVRKGNAEQPVELHLAEYPGRPYKPGKSMRRVLVAAWGADASQYVGRRLHLYGDPDVKFGGQSVGGIRIRAMSHIPGPARVNLTVTRGKREPFQVLPLEDEVSPPKGWGADVEGCESVDEIQAFYEMAREAGWWSPVVAQACTARKEALSDSN